MSYIGSVLDPIADKVLVGVLTIALSMVHLIPGKLIKHDRRTSEFTFNRMVAIEWMNGTDYMNESKYKKVGV